MSHPDPLFERVEDFQSAFLYQSKDHGRLEIDIKLDRYRQDYDFEAIGEPLASNLTDKLSHAEWVEIDAMVRRWILQNGYFDDIIVADYRDSDYFYDQYRDSRDEE